MSSHVFRVSRFLAILVLSLVAIARSAAQVPTAPITLSPEQSTKLHNLVSRVLSHANQVRCKPGRCDVLVTNFTDQKGNTSILGMQLAEEVSKDDSFVANQIRTTPRSMTQSYLESQRIPSRALNDVSAVTWFAREMSADAVLMGQLKVEGTGLELKLQLLGSDGTIPRDTRKTKTERELVAGLATPSGLAPAEPFGDLPEVEINGEKIPKLKVGQNEGSQEMTLPSCPYKPDPPYSEFARQAKYQGVVVLQTVISKDGLMADVRPLTGAPFGLNSISVATVRTWRCKPSTIGGKPISAVVPIEISFRLF